MSKEAALATLTGQTNNVVNPSLITGDMGQTTLAAEIPVQGEQVKAKLESDRDALIARKEAKFQREREAFNKEREQILKERAQAKEFYDKAVAFEEKRKLDPISALKEIGFSETEVFNFLADSKPKELTPEEIARSAAKEELENYKKEQLSVQQQAEADKNKAIISQFKGSIKETIAKNADTYEYLAFNGPIGEELVYDYIDQVLKDSGELMDLKEAFEAVENYYEEQDKAMSTIKKRQPKTEAVGQSPGLAPAEVKTPERTRTLSPQVGAPVAPKALTNKAAPSAAAAVPRKESSEQKKQRLIQALIKGSL